MPSDELLIEVYIHVDIPADQLVSHQVAGDRFIAVVCQRTVEPIDRERVLCRMLTLRKMGRLPRLRRKCA